MNYLMTLRVRPLTSKKKAGETEELIYGRLHKYVNVVVCALNALTLCI